MRRSKILIHAVHAHLRSTHGHRRYKIRSHTIHRKRGPARDKGKSQQLTMKTKTEEAPQTSTIVEYEMLQWVIQRHDHEQAGSGEYSKARKERGVQ
eukprot:4854293-Pyramimonas_sp.AAC.1